MKLFDATTPASRDLREHHEELPEFPADITVPDDLSGMPDIDTSGGRRAVRWMRWVPLGLLVAAGGLTITLALNDSGTEPTGGILTSETVEVDGPGSNSLNVAVVGETVAPAGVDGPGSNSLNVAVVGETVAPAEVDGPGSNSLNVEVVGETVTPVEVDGPGSNSLDVEVVGETVTPVEVDGPGSNSLDVAVVGETVTPTD